MHKRNSRYVLYALVYVAGLFAINWIGTSVLCLGDRKFEGGCGEYGLYLLAAGICLTPLALAGAGVAWLAGVAGATFVLTLSSVAVLGTLALSYVWEGWQRVLLGDYIGAGVIAATLFVRNRRRFGAASSDV